MAENDVVYVEATSAFGDADYGKIPAGKVLRMEKTRANRFLAAGVAKESTEAAFNKYTDERQARVDERGRKEDFDSLDRPAVADDWDTSTTRDVTMAPEEGIRRAYAQGRLVNTNMLRDKDGVVLPADASLEEILEARKNLAFGESELTAHERSSVQGGGPHTHRPTDTFDTLGGKAPLNARSQDLSPEQLGNTSESRLDKRRGPRKAEEGVKGNPGQGS